jgi:hypothetical protein
MSVAKSLIRQYPAKHPDDPFAGFLRQCPDADKTNLTVAMLRKRMALTWACMGSTSARLLVVFWHLVLASRSSGSRQVLDEISKELEMKSSDARWYVPDLSEEEWDEMGSWTRA